MAYDCADKAAHPSFARNKLASSDDAGGGDRGGGGIGGDITGDGSSASKVRELNRLKNNSRSP